jgi:hypothetical protein
MQVRKLNIFWFGIIQDSKFMDEGKKRLLLEDPEKIKSSGGVDHGRLD